MISMIIKNCQIKFTKGKGALTFYQEKTLKDKRSKKSSFKDWNKSIINSNPK